MKLHLTPFALLGFSLLLQACSEEPGPAPPVTPAASSAAASVSETAAAVSEDLQQVLEEAEADIVEAAERAQAEIDEAMVELEAELDALEGRLSELDIEEDAGNAELDSARNALNNLRQ